VICIINSSAQTDILLLDASNSCDLTLSKDIIVHRANKMKYKMTLFQFLLAIILVITSGQKINSFGTDSDCPNCVDDSTGRSGNRWTMPLQRLGDKQYYLGIFFKANWYKSEQYCRFHGMHLASINSAEEQRDLQDHIQAYGMGHEHFWTSGTDQGEEGKFFWMSNGKPVTFENWNAGEPNNFVYEDGEEEHCLEMWDRDGKGLKWNDTPCSFSTFFICEA